MGRDIGRSDLTQRIDCFIPQKQVILYFTNKMKLLKKNIFTCQHIWRMEWRLTRATFCSTYFKVQQLRNKEFLGFCFRCKTGRDFRDSFFVPMPKVISKNTSCMAKLPQNYFLLSHCIIILLIYQNTDPSKLLGTGERL